MGDTTGRFKKRSQKKKPTPQGLGARLRNQLRLQEKKRQIKKAGAPKKSSGKTIPLIGAGAGVAGAKGLRSKLSKLGAGAGVAAGKGLRSKLSKLGQRPKQTTNRRTEARNQANQKMKTKTKKRLKFNPSVRKERR